MPSHRVCGRLKTRQNNGDQQKESPYGSGPTGTKTLLESTSEMTFPNETV